MEKIIVRNKVSKKSRIASQLMKYVEHKQYGTKDDFIKDVGIKEVFKNIFDENIDADRLEDTTLYYEFKRCEESGEANDYFVYMYKIDDEFCLNITDNIYLYHIVQNISIQNDLIVPWSFVDSKIYFGDSWWENDSTIISDFSKLTIIEFVKKYKMY